jgi:hypothetical protein
MRILDSMEENSELSKQQNRPDAAASTAVETNPFKRMRLDEEIKDLEKDDANLLKGATLNLSHVDRYFYAPRTSNQSQSQTISRTASSAAAVGLKGQDLKAICENSLGEINNWNLNVKKVNSLMLWLIKSKNHR